MEGSPEKDLQWKYYTGKDLSMDSRFVGVELWIERKNESKEESPIVTDFILNKMIKFGK